MSSLFVVYELPHWLHCICINNRTNMFTNSYKYNTNQAIDILEIEEIP